MDEFDQDEQREEAAKRAAVELRRDAEAFQWLMSDEHGRRIARRLVARAGLMRNEYSGEQYVAAFREGQRSAGAAFIDDVRTFAPDQFTTLFEDNQ